VILTVIGTVFIIVAINGKKGRGQIAIQKAFHLNFPPFCGQIVTRSINFKQAETSNFAHDNVIGTGGSTNLSGVCLSVRLSVCPTHHSPTRRCGGFAAVGPAGWQETSNGAAAANAGSTMLPADAGSWTQTYFNMQWLCLYFILVYLVCLSLRRIVIY